MRRLFLAAALVWSGLLALTAQPGFNHTYTTSEVESYWFEKCLVVNDTIVCFGGGWPVPGDSVWRQSLIMQMIDSSGNLLKTTIVQDSLGSHLATEPEHPFIATTDGGYIAITEVIGPRASVLFKFDHALNLSYRIEIPDYPTMEYRGIIETHTGYLLAGYTQTSSARADGFIRKIGKNGQPLWLRYYINSNSVEGTFWDFKRLTDSTFVGVGGLSTGNRDFHESSPLIIEIDTDGQVLRRYEEPYDGPLDCVNRVLPLPDGGYLLYTWKFIKYTDPTDPTPSPELQPCLSRMDSGFNILWQTCVGANWNYQNRFWDVQPTLDGDFVAAGPGLPFSRDADSTLSGWVYKFSPEGKGRWMRLDYAPGRDVGKDWHYLGSVGTLSSGNLIAGGTATGPDGFSGWLLKISPDGCIDTLSCAPILSSSVSPPALQSEGLALWPNPAAHFLNLRWPEGFRATSLEIFNANGQRMATANTGFSESQAAVVVADFPPGLYLAVVKDAEGKVLRGKFVVAR